MTHCRVTGDTHSLLLPAILLSVELQLFPKPGSNPAVLGANTDGADPISPGTDPGLTTAPLYMQGKGGRKNLELQSVPQQHLLLYFTDGLEGGSGNTETLWLS